MCGQALEVDGVMDYVAYHSQDIMGSELGDGPPFGMYSKKSVRHLMGKAVWVIEGRGTPKQYYLKHRFVVDSVKEVESEYFRFEYTGAEGKNFIPEILLSNQPWFRDFLRAGANFSLGVSELKPEFLRRFLELADFSDTDGDGSPEQSDWQLTEGEIRTALHTYRTRSSDARKQCIEHHGSACFVCKIDFAAVYGKEYIEVHHRKLLADADGPREVDPIKDLIPLCPNCHRALHLLEVSVDDLAAIYRARRK